MKKAKGIVTRALISVFDKTGIVDFAKGLADRGVEILSSGGTAGALDAAGVPVTRVEAYTGAPEVLGGRVKTLHPKIHAGILADRRNDAHLAELKEVDALPIDLVVCSLYPFRETLAKGGSRAELIEKIDVGGPTMIRAAAKNADGGITVVTDASDYDRVLAAMQEDGSVPEPLRRELAVKAFRLTADYDNAIATWGETQSETPDAEAFPTRLGTFARTEELRYGENPHQRGFLYVDAGEARGVAHGQLLAGKALSYNNYLDMDGAYRAVHQLQTPGCSIVKHTNPCGLAEGTRQAEAFERALAGDPLSAFGSVIAFNAPLEGATAEAIKESKLFVECILAPAITDEAQAVFAKRKNLRLVVVPGDKPDPAWHGHRIGGGMLIQSTDVGLADPTEWKCVTKRQLEDGWLEELAFAMRAAMVLKSNAIAITKSRALLGAGAGHMSRVDACEQALKKAGDEAKDAFLGSDAFFPFDDSVRTAAAAGVAAVVQPGGSKRDDEVIAACDELGLAMLFTDRRHFRH
jgi:phosphoribosylaminoimidazolecarboxamide formyltransferase/IMP cyclohydrolase